MTPQIELTPEHQIQAIAWRLIEDSGYPESYDGADETRADFADYMKEARGIYAARPQNTPHGQKD